MYPENVLSMVVLTNITEACRRQILYNNRQSTIKIHPSAVGIVAISYKRDNIFPSVSEKKIFDLASAR